MATLLLAAACGDGSTATTVAPPPPSSTSTQPAPAPTAPTTTMAPPTMPPTTTTELPSPFARPDWLGTRVLPLRDDDFGVAQPTPPELVDRHLETPDLLPPPNGAEFEWTIDQVPEEVVARSTWEEGCPVALDELRYLTVSHHGFDGEFHTGEIIVNASVAEDVVGVFRALHDARYPIEEMRVIRADELDAPPTGDGNVTTSFVCRPAVGSTNWSQHAFGLAVDVNPFHNPYLKGDLVLPELATAYTDRTVPLDGMIFAGDVVHEAFTAIGWGWGGNWNSLKDWMHFSRSGN